MGLFDAPETRTFLGTPVKKVSDEDKAKAAAADARKKKVETFVAFQEKLDEIQKLQAEIQVAKMNAVQASPGVFALGLGSPGLNLGPEGLAGLAQRGGADLAATQARLQAWLSGINPAEYQSMSQERQALIQQYMQMEQYLRAVMRDNQLLQEELAYTQSVAQRHHHAFDGHFDDGADPAWDAMRGGNIAGSSGGVHSHHPHALGHSHGHGHGHVHNTHHAAPHAHTHGHGHVQSQAFHHSHCAGPAICTSCPPAPVHAPIVCTDPCCQGACGGSCGRQAPNPLPYGRYAQNLHDPLLSPGFARARAAQAERDRWFPARQW